MPISPWEQSSLFNTPQEQSSYQPMGDNATVEENFSPQYSQVALKSIIDSYKTNPSAFNQEQKDRIKKHAYFYNVPFYEGDFDIVDAMKQFGVGLIEGFTTLGGNLADHPDNEYEAVVRNVGHLIGFAPSVLSKPLKMLGVKNATIRAATQLKSIPMRGADWLTKRAKKVVGPVMGTAFKGRANAARTASKFIGPGTQMIEGAFHLGAASAISSWKQGVDGMLESAFGGAIFGGGFAAIGNIFPGKNTFAIKALAGSLFQGLPSTHRGATTPEQVYDYLMGAFFGGQAVSYKRAGALKFFGKMEKEIQGEGESSNNRLKLNRNPEDSRHWNKLGEDIQKEVEKLQADEKGDFYNHGGVAEIFNKGIIKDLKLNLGKDGEPTKKSYDSLAEIVEQKPSEIGSGKLANETEKELVEIHEKRLKINEDIANIKEALPKSKESQRLLFEENIENLESKLVDLDTRQAELDSLKPMEYIDKESGTILIDESNSGNDIGMAPNRDITRTSEIIVEKNLESIWNKEGSSPLLKRNEQIRLTNIIDDIILKPKYKGKNVTFDTKELVKDIKDTIYSLEGTKIDIDKDMQNTLRQKLTVSNFGKPVRFLNVLHTKKGTYLLDREGNLDIRGNDGLTKAGNRKRVIEPLKIFEEELGKINQSLIKERPFIVADFITTYNKEGRRVDSSLSDLRGLYKGSPSKYKNIIKSMHLAMNKKGYYPYGGKGDNDVIIYMKKHPYLKDTSKVSNVKGFFTNLFNKKPKLKKQFDEAIKRRPNYITEKEAKDNYYSNLFYDVMMNGFKPKTATDWFQTLDKVLNGKGYISNATAWNKRNQIWFTPSWRADKEFISNNYTKFIENIKGEKSKELIDASKNGKVRYIIAEDLDPALFKLLPDGTKKRIKELNTKSKNTEHGEHVDGMILVEDTYLDTLIADSGMPESGQSKSFIVSPDANNGALLGKYMMHSVGKKASEHMRKTGLHMIMQESAVKQRGERKLNNYGFNKDSKGNIVDMFVKDNNAIYEMPVEDIRYGYSVKQNNEMAGYTIDSNGTKRIHKHRIPKQLLMAMTQNTFKAFPTGLIEDFMNETVWKSYKGDKAVNKLAEEYLENPKDTFRLNYLEKNIDKLGIDTLVKVINSESTPLADAAYSRLMKLNNEGLSSRVANGELRAEEADEIIQNIDSFNSAMDRVTESAIVWASRERAAGRTGEINPVLMHKWIRPYRFQVIRNYVFGNISRPKIGNSGVGRMRGYDKWFQEDPKFKELETRDDIFYLDNNFKEMPLRTHIKNYEKTTLGKFWNAYNTKGSNIYHTKAAKDVLTALTVRVPMDSVSGAQRMEFKGFTDRKGHGILMHSRAMKAEGGADLDGDESFIFFGGRKGNKGDGFRKKWKDAFFKNKEEFYKQKGKDKIKIIGGFENKGKGTPEGDGKDKAMRKIADSAIVELSSNKPSSSKTSLDKLGTVDFNSDVIMLARNGSLKGKPLRPETLLAIEEANKLGVEFVVGDMPGVDSQFIKHLDKIGAKYKVYHTGSKPRIPVLQKKLKAIKPTLKGEKTIYNNKNEDVKKLLTTQDSFATSGINPESRDSNMWKYDSTWRQELSERAVEGRRLLGGTATMTQILKTAHNSIFQLPGNKNTFKVSVPAGWKDKKTKYITIPITIEARTSAAELDKARELSSSMVAFSADPLDVAGLTGYTDYYNKLHSAYFKVSVPKKYKKIWDKLGIKNKVRFFKSNKGVVGQLGDMNSALFSKDFHNDASWSAGEIKNLTRHVNNPNTFGIDKLNNSMLPKMAKLANEIDLLDSPFNYINVKNLESMYSEHRRLIEKFPEITTLLNRESVEVPLSVNAIKVLVDKLYQPDNLIEVAKDFALFKKYLPNSQYGKNGKNAISNEKLLELIPHEKLEVRKQILKNIVKFAEDSLTQDVNDMVSFRQIYKYYNESKVDPVIFAKMHKAADYIKRHSYLMRTNEGYQKESRESELSGEEFERKLAEEFSGRERKIENDDGSKLMTQTEIDNKILAIKKTLPDNRSKKLFDMLVLGSLRKDSKKTAINKVGFTSRAIDNESVIDFIGDFSSVMKKSYGKPDLEKGKKIAKSYEKGDMMEKDAPVLEAKSIIKDSTTGYEGLHGKPDMKNLPRSARELLTEVVEHIKFYNNGVGKGLNLITRGMVQKDLNTMTIQDWKNVNNYFKEIKGGTFWQKLFGDTSMEMKQRYHYNFPATVGREMMKYDIDFMKKRGLFLTKDAQVVPGDIKVPTNYLERAQHSIAINMDSAQAKSDEEVGNLRKSLQYIDSLPEGESLRRVAVRQMEAEGNISKLETSKYIEKALGKQWAENYRKALNDELVETDYSNSLKDKIFKIENERGERIDIDGEGIVKDIKYRYKKHFNDMHSWISGESGSLDSYIVKKNGKIQYWDYDLSEPKDYKYDYKKFIKDINKDYNSGDGISKKFGIDGLRKIARSMMFDLSKKTDLFKLRKSFSEVVKTGEIKEGYWPHMFFDKSSAKKAMVKAIDSIEKSNLSRKEKDKQIERIMYRSKTLTGDWIGGTENWESYDKVIENIRNKQKIDKMHWWEMNQMTGSMHKRTSHIPGHSIDSTVAESYTRNVIKTYYKQMAQIFSRNLIAEFGENAKKHNWHKTMAAEGSKMTLRGAWINYLKLYAQDAMENPTIIPDYMLNDPGMKLKGTPYAWWADSNVKKKMNSIAGKLGLEEKYGLERFDYGDLKRWSNLEAKFELMALLAHPKSAVYNLFGGTMHSIQSAGATYVKRVRDYNFLRTINKKWTDKQAVLDFVIGQGVFPEMLMHEWGLQKELKSANSKSFLKAVGKKLSNTGEVSKKTFFELGKEHKMSSPAVEFAAKFMSKPEMILRKDAFMAHYLRAWDQFGGAITQYDHPFLIEMAKKGVKATQFLYSAPYRPAFSRTSLGKIMTRFQTWSWNAARFRNDVLRESRIAGHMPGTAAFEKFKRTAQIDALVMALGSVFAFSIFDQAIPAPLSYFKDTAEWLFGDEDTRNKAFFGAWSNKKTGTILAPLQIITPPIARLPLNLLKAQIDDNYSKFFDYSVYTMFPFGRMVRDVAPWAKGNILSNPYRTIEKFTGVPYGDIQRKRKKLKEEDSYHPKFPIIG